MERRRRSETPRVAGSLARAQPGHVRSRGVLALMIAVALSATILASCTSGSRSSGDASRRDAGNEWTVGDGGGTRQLTPNVEVTVPEGALPAGTVVRINPGTPTAIAAAGQWRHSPSGARGPSLVTDVVSVETSSTKLAKPAVLRLRVNDGPIEPDMAFLAFFDEQRSTWMPVGGEFDPATRMLSITTEHFSMWAGFTWLSEEVKQIFRDVGRELLGPRTIRLPALSCSGNSSVSLEVSGVKELETCTSGGPDGAVNLKIRNSRAYSLALLAPVGSASLEEAPGLSQYAREMLGKVTNTPGTIYLPSGATANIRLELPPGASARVVTDADMYAYLLDAIALSVEVYVATYTTLLGASTEEQRVVADALGSAVDFPRCAEDALRLSLAGDITQDTLSKWGEVGADCVGVAANGLGKSALKDVAQAVARFASIAAFVVRIIRTVVASGEILGDMFTNTVAYLPAYTLVTLNAPPLPPPCPRGSTCLAEMTADLDGDRRPDRIGLFVDGGAKRAQAVLATGQTTTLQVTQSDIPSLNRTPLDAIGVVDVDGDGREEAIIRTGKGGNTFYPVGILKLDGDRLMLVGEPQGTEADSFMVDGGVAKGAGFRCGPRGPDGVLRLTVNSVQRQFTNASPDPGAWAWETRQYRWVGAKIQFEKVERGTVVAGPNASPASDSRLAAYYGVHCDMR